MSELKINLPIEVSPEEAKLFLIIKLYEVGKLSLGKAAEMANYSKSAFMEILGKHKIPVFNYDSEDLVKELALWKKS